MTVPFQMIESESNQAKKISNFKFVLHHYNNLKLEISRFEDDCFGWYISVGVLILQ